MQINKEYESEISLKDLFFHVLYRWRSILVIALIGAVLLGGYKFFSLRKSGKAETPAPAVQQTEQEKAEEEEEQQAARALLEEKAKQVQELEDYLNESVYIQLQPQGVWTAACKYLLKTTSDLTDRLTQGVLIDPADGILAAYSYPLDGAPEEELLEAFGTDKPEYVYELVESGINTEDNTVTLRVKGATKEAAQKGLKYVQGRIEKLAAQVQDLGAHTLIKTGEDIRLGVDTALNGRQAALKTALDQSKKELDAAKQQAAELKIEGKTGVSKKEVLKFALIGLLAGIFVMACLYAFHYILRGKLNDGAGLAEQYGIPVFGELQKSSSIHNGKSLDKFISKWELGKNRTGDETVCGNICALLREKQEAESFLLVSTLKADKLEKLHKALSAKLQDKTIETRGGFLTDSEAISAAANAEAVILVEEKNESRTRDIERMAETLLISKANVIGAIVI